MPKSDGPLGVLEDVLRSVGPPSLGILYARLRSVEFYEDFLKLVREYVPEGEEDIIRLLLASEQVELFTERFSARYFPLYEGAFEDEEAYECLCGGIPLVVHGIDYDSYHELADGDMYRPGWQLMAYLWQCSMVEEDNGRVALAEACEKLVSRTLLQRVPKGGFSDDDYKLLIKQLKISKKYKGAAHFYAYLNQDTGNCLLDFSDQDMGEMGQYPQWDREQVDDITEAWKVAQVILAEIDRISKWLEADPPAHFEELISFIESKREVKADGDG